MKAIYKCMHCGQAKEVQIPSVMSNWMVVAIIERILNRDAFGVPQYQPHECEPKILGVAMLVAVHK